MNLSEKKVFYYKEGFGEFTSWYQDVSQFGVEIAKLRPQGKNPHDDFNSLAKAVNVSLNANEINTLGAEAMERIGVDNVRRLYKINKKPFKRMPEVSETTLLLADGGNCPWTGLTAGIDEIADKWNMIQRQEDKDYFYKILSPDCPMVADPEEKSTYSFETGCLTTSLPETPRNVFTWHKASNRTLNAKTSEETVKFEKANQVALKIATDVSPALLLIEPADKTSLAIHLKSMMETTLPGINLSTEEEDSASSERKAGVK